MRWLLAFIVTRLALYAKAPHCAEDAYITFRAARNWLTYGAPTFNLGEPSWPASSPLWSMWMFAGIGLGVDVEWWSRIGSLIAEVMLLLAVHKMLGRKGAIAFGILLAGHQCAIAISLSGIEMFAMVAAFAWALLGSRTATFLLVFSRPEGIVLALIASWGRWRRNWVALTLGCLVWVCMAVLTQSLMPAGVSAKVGTYGLHWLAGVKWLGLFWPGGGLEQQSMGSLGFAAILLLIRTRLQGPGLAFAVVGFGLLAAYFLSGSVYFFWYMTLPICAAMLCVASACSRIRGGLVVAGLIAAASWTNNYPFRRWNHQYNQLARVAYRLPESGTVVMDAIGVTGWLRPHVRFIDVVGLSSHHSERLRKTRKDGWLTDLIQTEYPDAVVVKLLEAMNNLPDAGAGRPFRPDTISYSRSKDAPMLVGSLINIRRDGKVTCGVIGYRVQQIDQDVILTLDEPKP